MARRLKGFLLASLLLLGSAPAYALPDRCQLDCFCYNAEDRAGQCGTIASSGCIIVHCI